MEKKTIAQWLNTLPNPIKKAAFRAYKIAPLSEKDEPASDMVEALYYAFNWERSETMEFMDYSFDFWQRVKNAYAQTAEEERKKIIKKLSELLSMILLIFIPSCLPAQEPSLYINFQDTSCTQLLGPDHDSIALAALGYELNEEWVSIGTDTFTGFWLNERFFVPDRGIVLTIMDCGVTFDYVPHFGTNQEPIYTSKWHQFISTKSQPIATWSRIAGYVFMGLGGYFGSEGERQRVVNGLDSPAFHHNRDLSLACAFSAGATFTLSWGKTPNLRWWEPPFDAFLGAVLWYTAAQKNWESYK